MTRRELWASVNGNYAVGVQVVERELERSTADPGGEAAPP
jgi:hypothetical protein